MCNGKCVIKRGICGICFLTEDESKQWYRMSDRSKESSMRDAYIRRKYDTE